MEKELIIDHAYMRELRKITMVGDLEGVLTGDGIQGPNSTVMECLHSGPSQTSCYVSLYLTVHLDPLPLFSLSSVSCSGKQSNPSGRRS